MLAWLILSVLQAGALTPPPAPVPEPPPRQPVVAKPAPPQQVQPPLPLPRKPYKVEHIGDPPKADQASKTA